MMDEFLGHVMKYKIIVNIYSPFGKEICRAEDSFSSVSRRVSIQSISLVLSAILNLIKELPMATDKL